MKKDFGFSGSGEYSEHRFKGSKESKEYAKKRVCAWYPCGRMRCVAFAVDQISSREGFDHATSDQ